MKDWPELLGDPKDAVSVTVARIETTNGIPLDDAVVVLESPDGTQRRLSKGDVFSLQVRIQYEPNE